MMALSLAGLCYRRSTLALVVGVATNVSAVHSTHAQSSGSRLSRGESLRFRNMSWGLDSIATRTELEEAGFILTETSRLRNAVFRGQVFGLNVAVTPEFRRRGLSHVRVRFETDSVPLGAVFTAVRDSLVARHGQPASTRDIGTALPNAFWGRIATGTLLLSTNATPNRVIVAYSAPDPETAARLYTAVRPERDSANLEDRLYLSHELTDRPFVVYCPKAAAYRKLKGTVQFNIQLTKYGRPEALGVSPVDSRYSELQRAAEDYVFDCAFSPGRINGQPVRTVLSVAIPFGQ